MRVKKNFVKKLFWIFFVGVILIFLVAKKTHSKSLEKLQTILSKVENHELTVDELKITLGIPDEDTYQVEKIYNLDQNKKFNCESPFRYISYSRNFLIFFELKLEDNLHFYFDKNGKVCFFERNGL